MAGERRGTGRGQDIALRPVRSVVVAVLLWSIAWLVLLAGAVWDRHETGYLGLAMRGRGAGKHGWRVLGVRPGSPAAQLGVAPGWVLRSLEGRPVSGWTYWAADDLKTRSALERWRAWHRWVRSRIRPGRPVHLVFQSPSGTRNVVLTAVRTPLAEWVRSGLLSVFVGSLFLLLGLVLVLRRPDNAAARRLLLYALFFQAFLFTQAVVQFPRLLAISRVERLLSFGVGDVLFNLSAVAMLLFVLAFALPERREPRWLAWTVYGLALAAAGAYVWRLGGRLFLFFAPLVYTAGMALLLVQYRRESRVVRRKQLKWLLWGGGIPVATLGVVYGLTALPWFDVIRSSSVDVMILSTLTFPVAVLMAVQSDRLFDIDSIVRRSLLVALLLPILVVGYAGLVGMLGGALASWANPGFLLVALLVVLLMLPGQVRVEEVIDRLAGRNRFGGARRLQALAGLLAEKDNVSEVALTAAEEVRQALDLVACAIFVAEPLDQKPERLCAPYSVGTWNEEPRGVHCSFLERLEPGVLFPEKRRDLALPEGLGDPKPVALVLLSAGSRRLGLLAAGPAADRGAWRQEALPALVGAAGAVAAALDRIQHRLLLEQVRSMQAQVIHSGRLAVLGTFAAGLAHELNTPLGYIKANAQIVARKLGDRPDLEALVRDVEQGADQMHQVVANLRSFASLDHPDLILTDINDSVRETLKMLDMVGRRDVRVETDLGELPKVPVRPVQINQVLLNLVSNALDASPSRATVVVRTRADEEFVEITVEDEGPGLPEEHLEALFDPFFTTKPPGKGMGLGLSITRIIVEAHGGEITLTNRREAGACARVRLPLAGVLEEESRHDDDDAEEVS